MGADTLQFTDVAAEADLAEGGMHAVQVGGKRVLLALVDGRPFAMGAICTHERANLDEGTLMGHEVYCPLHFSCFDVRTGEALAPPAEQSAPVYAVKVVDGRVLVSSAPVEADDLDALAHGAGEDGSAQGPSENGRAAVADEAPAAEVPAAEVPAAERGPADPATVERGPAEAPAADVPHAAGPDTDGAVSEEVAPRRPPAEPAPPCATPGPASIHAALIGRIERQGWLERAAQSFGTALRPVRESPVGGHLFDVLHGRVLGHALHPALSDLPIGLWAGAVLLRIAGEADAAAILAVAGVLAGLATAATGVADWTVSDGRDRRVGLLHGITQTIALCIVTASVVVHALDGAGAVTFVLLVAGTGLSMASAYLGGHLVFGRGVMVDHTAWTTGPRHWTRAVALADVPRDGATAVDLEGRKVLVSRIDGRIAAIENACTHAGGPLAMGRVRDGVVTCPWHGSCFRLRDGAVVKGPAQNPQPMLEARVRDGWVELRAPRH